MKTRIPHHYKNLNAIVCSPVGEVLVTRGALDSGENAMRILDLGSFDYTHDEMKCNHGHIIAFSPDGGVFAVDDWNATTTVKKAKPGSWEADTTERVELSELKLFDLANGKLRLTIAHSGRIRAVAFSPDGRLIATRDSDNAVKLWKADSGTLLSRLNHSYDKESCALLVFSPDATKLASVGTDQRRGDGTYFELSTRVTVAIFDLGSGIVTRSTETHFTERWVSSFALSPDGKLAIRLRRSDRANEIEIFDIQSGERAEIGRCDGSGFAEFSQDGQLLLSSGKSFDFNKGWWRSVEVINVKSKQVIAELKQDARVGAFSPGGNMVVLGIGSEIRLWDYRRKENLLSRLLGF